MALVGAGMVFTTAAVLVSYVFDDLLPADAHFWGVLALAALALGSFLLGGAVLATARAKEDA